MPVSSPTLRRVGCPSTNQISKSWSYAVSSRRGSLSPMIPVARQGSKARREADVLFMAVGTPARGRGSADLSNVADVARVYIDISCDIRPARGAIPGPGSRPEGAQEGFETERGTPIERARSGQEDPGLPKKGIAPAANPERGGHEPRGQVRRASGTYALTLFSRTTS